ncbi:MAG: LytTR family transcriptional regulator DNA-binding domain-containing protein [Clostridia bacterium]|nr:LytTR family transcriptional regulator [Oscillospiraceae bacterium]MBQ8275816.1 LytTR family transcriptional regulator DNA-binding domain-containing protein [Clostridia bacterium]
MKINLMEDPTLAETEILIRCPSMQGEVREIVAALNLVGNTVAGQQGEDTCFVPLGDLLYFESVDDRVFFYTAEGTYETPSKLYQIEEKLKPTSFVRISKSAIVNLRRVTRMRREKNSRLLVTLSTGESLVVSRQYMPAIKEKLEVLI